jgi:ribose-phosphate pyrophosphokinase
VHKQEYENVIVVSPDVGGVVRARALAKRLDCDLAIIDKRRPKANVAEVMNIIGDVSGRTCVIMDDMVDTANTLVKAAAALKEHGRVKRRARLLHAPGAVRWRGRSHRELAARRTGRHRHHSAAQGRPRRQLSCAQLLAETILRINRADSVSSLFVD